MTLRITWSARDERIDGVAISPDSTIEHVLEFDAVTRETHDASATLTEKAVESGAPITDHKIRNQRAISIEAIVSNTPIGAPPPSGLGPSPVSVQAGKSERGAGANVRIFSAAFDRMTDVHATLDMLANEPIPVTITTRTRVYEAAQILRATVPRTPDDGDSLTITIDIREIRVAESRRVDIPRPREPRGRGRTSSGTQSTTEATTPEEQSVLSQGADAVLERIGRL